MLAQAASWFEGFMAFLTPRLPELWLRTGEHLMLTGIATGVAILVGIPLGILAARVRPLRGGLTGGVGILQTIPSLAMLMLVYVILDGVGVPALGAPTAIIALILYALLPIVRNTLTGLQGVSPAVVEAASGIGMNSSQRLWLVEVPLAMPVIVAGVRTAAVVGVGIATLSAFIGAGGLGQFINRGLALYNWRLILLGAIPAAILALIVDGAIAALQWGLRRKRSGATAAAAALDRFFRPLALAAPVLLVAAGCFSYFSTALYGRRVTIATKNFTEQLVLGEIMAQLIENRADATVDRRFNLGGTPICHEALANGEVDIYAEYTGTALTAILKQPVLSDPDEAYDVVKEAYSERFGIEWLPPFGFNNTYAITVRRSMAEERGLEKLSDLIAISGQLRAGFTAEFSERPDGYPGLKEAYGLRFKDVRDLDPSLMYQSVKNEDVDVICAFATDGRIAAYDLKPLDDDRNFFPPYHAAPLVRRELLLARPEIREALELLAGRLDAATMQRLNYEVDGKTRSPAEVAREFLEREGLLE